ncbi:MAG: glycosyltransferase [Ignavibacteriales bacterium]|nr:glycosyltransferase [Ignavibacteriales bacterium]
MVAHGLPEGTPYALYVGSLKPHKNIPVLLKAFAQLGDFPDLRLVLSGEPFDANDGLLSLARNLGIRDRIIDAGGVSTEGLVSLYQKASVVVLPSLYEGFGLPILEAMACGTPIIGARAASIPEVMGEGGMMFDPTDAGEPAGLIRSVLTDRSLRRLPAGVRAGQRAAVLAGGTGRGHDPGLRVTPLHALTTEIPMVTVILVQYNRSDLTRRAIRTLAAHGASNHQVILVDNCSTEPGALAWTGEFSWLEVISLPANRGFGAANNAGARAAREDPPFPEQRHERERGRPDSDGALLRRHAAMRGGGTGARQPRRHAAVFPGEVADDPE